MSHSPAEGLAPATLAPDERVMLRTARVGGDLDQYLFTDLAHAVTWLSQGFVQQRQDCYAVSIVTLRYKKRACTNCGHREWSIMRQRRMNVMKFLEVYGDGNK